MNDRPVFPPVADRGGPPTWSDLIAIATESRPGPRRTYTSPHDNRVRQIGSTLNHLAHDDVQLVHLPNGSRRKAKYEGFMLLNEAGDLERASVLPYRVPQPFEPVFGLPPSFFLRGWHAVLSDSEMALLFALLAHVGLLAWAPGTTAQLDGTTRIQFHGLSLDTYATHKYLARYGLLEVVPDENRRPDGTFEGQREGLRPIPHQLRVLEQGFDRDAMGVVSATLKGMGVAKPPA
ncbi:hypothetical protein [Geodermatophilus sp. SYSU D00705]